jgi:hypothetical protein
MGVAGGALMVAGLAGTVGCFFGTVEFAGPESFNCAYIGLAGGSLGGGLVAAGAERYYGEDE